MLAHLLQKHKLKPQIDLPLNENTLQMPHKVDDLSNQIFGRLTAKEYRYTKYGERHWYCECSCGGNYIASAHALKRGLTRSCGCLKKLWWSRPSTPPTCGHPDRKHIAQGMCPECYAQKVRPAQKSRQRAAKKVRLGPEEWQRYRKRKALWAAHKITLEAFEKMLEWQDGKCACGKTFNPIGSKSSKACIDHNHSCCPTGRSCGKCIRGLLCFRCNSVLGFLENDPHLLPEYLKNYLVLYAKPEIISGL